jgi:hypothetical protein
MNSRNESLDLRGLALGSFNIACTALRTSGKKEKGILQTVFLFSVKLEIRKCLVFSLSFCEQELNKKLTNKMPKFWLNREARKQ